MLEYSTSLQDSLAYILGKGERLSTSDIYILCIRWTPFRHSVCKRGTPFKKWIVLIPWRGRPLIFLWLTLSKSTNLKKKTNKRGLFKLFESFFPGISVGCGKWTHVHFTQSRAVHGSPSTDHRCKQQWVILKALALAVWRVVVLFDGFQYLMRNLIAKPRKVVHVHTKMSSHFNDKGM